MVRIRAFPETNQLSYAEGHPAWLADADEQQRGSQKPIITGERREFLHVASQLCRLMLADDLQKSTRRTTKYTITSFRSVVFQRKVKKGQLT